jgi:FkbM family methyltransferase
MDRDIPGSLSAFISAFDARVQQSGDSYTLSLPGFEPMPWRAPIKKKPFARRNPNDRFYEETATAAMAYFFARMKSPVFLDAGAQWGYFTALALNFQSKAIDAYAFEINPLVTTYLQNALALAQARGRRGELLLSGLSDEHLGERDIWVSVTKMFEKEPREEDYREPWWIRLKMSLRGRKDRDIPQKFRVSITSIDHFCTERNLAPGLIKIDVDGYEAKVVPGALDTLHRHKPIIFLELHKKKFIQRFGVTRNEIVAPLFDLGYKALLLDDHHDRTRAVMPVTRDSPQVGREDTDMFIFYHEDNV